MRKDIKLKRAIWKNVFKQDPRVKSQVLEMDLKPKIEEDF
jgi:hypothetical protein